MLRPMEAGIWGSWHYQFFFFLLRQCYWRSIFFFFPKYHWRGGTDFPTTLCLATLPCSDDLCLEKEHCSSQGPFHCSLLHCLYHQEVEVFYFVLPFFTGAVESAMLSQDFTSQGGQGIILCILGFVTNLKYSGLWYDFVQKYFHLMFLVCTCKFLLEIIPPNDCFILLCFLVIASKARIQAGTCCQAVPFSLLHLILSPISKMYSSMPVICSWS